MRLISSTLSDRHYVKTLLTMALLSGMATMLLTACDTEPAQTSANLNTADEKASRDDNKTVDPRRRILSEQAKNLFGPLPMMPASMPDQPKVALGRVLFHDPRLSRDGDISCNTCHKLNTFGVDNQPTSAGHHGQRGTRNTPTVFNASLQLAQSWDGRSANVATQAKWHILNPTEMATDSDGIAVTKLASISGYVAMFQAAFPEEDRSLSYDTLASAIASFVEGLQTPGRFDAFMLGDLRALSAPEVSGLELFIETGCAGCHNGPTLGGTQFQKIGVVQPYDSADAGRMNVTGDENDRGVFKVPGLRNVARTRPYFHDGSVTRLVDAIRLMATHQLGKTLTDADAASIAMFLESLTGQPDPAYIVKPELPEKRKAAGSSGAS